MSAVLAAFARAFGQLGERRVLAVFAKSMAVTLAIVIALGAALAVSVPALLARWLAVEGDTVYLVTGVLGAIAAWLLFRVIALAVLQFFADEIVQAVELRHYPGEHAAARDVPWREEARGAIGGALRALLVNLLALPVALLLLVTGVGTALLFWAVNAWLLGRELTEMVWLRHRPPPLSSGESAAPPLGALTRFALGGIVAAMLLVPLVNLLAPVLGAAAATHLVHSPRRPRGGA